MQSFSQSPGPAWILPTEVPQPIKWNNSKGTMNRNVQPLEAEGRRLAGGERPKECRTEAPGELRSAVLVQVKAIAEAVPADLAGARGD